MNNYRNYPVPTVIYVVHDDDSVVKFGITNGDGKQRLKNHRSDGLGNIAFVRIGQPILLMFVIESMIINTLTNAGYEPVRGKEYYNIECLTLIITRIEEILKEWKDNENC